MAKMVYGLTDEKAFIWKMSMKLVMASINNHRTSMRIYCFNQNVEFISLEYYSYYEQNSLVLTQWTKHL